MADNFMDREQILEEKRKRQLAIIKASNQMLNDAKKSALEHNSDPVKRAELEQQFDKALDDNKNMAKNFFRATTEEIEDSSFRDADPIEVKKYQEYLKKRGLTEEELRRKESATVTIGENGKKPIPRRRRRGAKKDLGDDYKPLDNEEELMKLSMVTDDKQIEENIKKNREFEDKMIRDGQNIVKKMQKTLEDEKINNRVKIEDNIKDEKVEITSENKEENVKKEREVVKEAEVKQAKKKKRLEEVLSYDFDFSSIPSYVQYDVIPLPSKGQCYPKTSPLRCGRVPVAYLTASDENIIASPNMYRDGKLLDVILKRKVLDKRINVEDLCSGDRDAIILWLRGTSYGEDFPIYATNPETGKQYDVVINLSQFDYLKFDLDGDENGLFDYTTDNGDLIKFKFFTNNDEELLKKTISSQLTDYNKIEVLKNVRVIEETLGRIDFSDEETEMLKEDIDEVKTIVGSDLSENEDEEFLPNTITEQMTMHTVSVNGDTDGEFIKNYIENMRTLEAMNYRNYFVNNKPGIDFNFTVNIPESDGGGSFDSFLKLDDTVFINF